MAWGCLRSQCRLSRYLSRGRQEHRFPVRSRLKLAVQDQCEISPDSSYFLTLTLGFTDSLQKMKQTPRLQKNSSCERSELRGGEAASSPGSEWWDSRPGLLTLTERKSGGWCSPLLPCSGVLCLRTAWLGPFSELGNLLTVRDLSSFRPSSSDELLSRGFGGRGGGSPGLRVELKS